MISSKVESLSYQIPHSPSSASPFRELHLATLERQAGFSAPTCPNLEKNFLKIGKMQRRDNSFVDALGQTIAYYDYEATVIIDGRRLKNQVILIKIRNPDLSPQGKIEWITNAIGFIEGAYRALAPAGSKWEVRRNLTVYPEKGIRAELEGQNT